MFQRGTDELCDVEAVDDDHRVWEGPSGDPQHAVREVHRHLLDSQSRLEGKVFQRSRNLVDDGALDCGRQHASGSHSFLLLAGQKRVHLPIMEARFVNAEAGSQVFRQRHSRCRSLFLAPVPEPAQMLLVGTPKAISV